MPGVTLISTKPPFISPDEHRELTASTPVSFNDIPPVLRHQEDNISVTLDPPLDGFSEEDGRTGTLYIVDSVLAFISSTGRGIQVEYQTITLHAISRTEEGPSIYCQLDEQSETVPANDEDSDMRELKLIPQDAASLEAMFEALSSCASLHPDPAGESDDDMGMDDDAFIDADENRFEIFTGDEGQELSEVGRAAFEHLESIIVYPPGLEPHANGVAYGHGEVAGGDDVDSPGEENAPTGCAS